MLFSQQSLCRSRCSQIKSNQINLNQITDAATDNRLGIWGGLRLWCDLSCGLHRRTFLSLAYHERNGSGSGGDRPGVTVLISGH